MTTPHSIGSWAIAGPDSYGGFATESALLNTSESTSITAASTPSMRRRVTACTYMLVCMLYEVQHYATSQAASRPGASRTRVGTRPGLNKRIRLHRTRTEVIPGSITKDAMAFGHTPRQFWAWVEQRLSRWLERRRASRTCSSTPPRRIPNATQAASRAPTSARCAWCQLLAGFDTTSSPRADDAFVLRVRRTSRVTAAGWLKIDENANRQKLGKTLAAIGPLRWVSSHMAEPKERT